AEIVISLTNPRGSITKSCRLPLIRMSCLPGVTRGNGNGRQWRPSKTRRTQLDARGFAQDAGPQEWLGLRKQLLRSASRRRGADCVRGDAGRRAKWQLVLGGNDADSHGPRLSGIDQERGRQGLGWRKVAVKGLGLETPLRKRSLFALAGHRLRPNR